MLLRKSYPLFFVSNSILYFPWTLCLPWLCVTLPGFSERTGVKWVVWFLMSKTLDLYAFARYFPYRNSKQFIFWLFLPSILVFALQLLPFFNYLMYGGVILKCQLAIFLIVYSFLLYTHTMTCRLVKITTTIQNNLIVSINLYCELHNLCIHVE